MLAHAQIQEKGFDKTRLFTGGNLGLQFGNYTSIDVSPILGYKFTKRFAAGIGGVYQYYSYKDKNFPIYNFRTDIFGGKVFSRFYLFDFLFAHAEYEFLNLETKYFDPNNMRHNGERFWVHGVLVGAGYAQQVGLNSAFNIMLLFNINETIDSPYSNPIIRMGFDIGF